MHCKPLFDSIFFHFIRIFTILLFFSRPAGAAEEVVIGGKKFTENYILGEIIAQHLENRGIRVTRRLGLGGTLIAYQALLNDEIDIYVEYTGTLQQVILKQPQAQTINELNQTLLSQGLEVLDPLGFNNTYALAVKQTRAEKENWKSISDLKGQTLRVAFNFEFLKREDGWPSLSQRYGLNFHAKGVEHSLVYELIDQDHVDAINLYSTDAKIKHFDLLILDDDLSHFPEYLAVPFVRRDLSPKVREALLELGGQINSEEMIQLNARAEVEKQSFPQIAQKFLQQKSFAKKSGKDLKTSQRLDWGILWERTYQHLYLTFLAIFLAVLVALPLGVLLLGLPKMAQWVIGATGLLQTIPSIALLAFMIPVFGIGVKPAIMALFLYSLLPILRNTYVGLQNIDPQVIESGRGIGLFGWEILFFVRFPLGLPIILAGIRTAAVINIGTATLAAFIGAGGLGEPIVTGLSLNDHHLLLQGAIPAALLALLVELSFSYAEKATR